MNVRECMRRLGVNPFKYLILNIGTDSLDDDLKILQISYTCGWSVDTRYIAGGNPLRNDEITRIPIRVYQDKGERAADVENDIVDCALSDDIDYIVYNNDRWTKKVLEKKEWYRLLNLMHRKPGMALTDYETVRRFTGDTIFNLAQGEDVDMFDVCRFIIKNAKSVKGVKHVSLTEAYSDRGLTKEAIPAASTYSEQCVHMMEGILRSMFDNNKEEETYKV